MLLSAYPCYVLDARQGANLESIKAPKNTPYFTGVIHHTSLTDSGQILNVGSNVLYVGNQTALGEVQLEKNGGCITLSTLLSDHSKLSGIGTSAHVCINGTYTSTSGSLSNNYLTIPSTGTYILTLHVGAQMSNIYELAIAVNGTRYANTRPGNIADNLPVHITRMVNLSSGDVIRAYVQTSNTTGQTWGADDTYFYIEYVRVG